MCAAACLIIGGFSLVSNRGEVEVAFGETLRVKVADKRTETRIKCIGKYVVKQLRGLFKSEGVVGFYREMVEKSVGEYKRLAYLYQHFRAMMMALNNSTIVEKVVL